MSFVRAFLHAQAVGSITGVVTDPSGAVIPGVKVTASSVATGVSQYTVTSGAGTYTIPRLMVGTYNVTPTRDSATPGEVAAALSGNQQSEIDKGRRNTYPAA
jgi:hypothetical protein